MAEKLGIGATFPNIRLTAVDGSTISLPGSANVKYQVLLFYRGHW